MRNSRGIITTESGNATRERFYCRGGLFLEAARYRACASRLAVVSSDGLLRRQHKLIAIDILERGERAPLLFLRRSHELDTSGFQLFISLLDVVASQSPIEEAADAAFVAVGGEENEVSIGAADAHLNPA